MQLDNELRRRIKGVADELEVTTDDAFATVVRGRRWSLRPLAVVVAAAAIIAGLAFAGSVALRDGAPRPGELRPAAPAPLEGRFAAQVPAGGRAVRVYSLEGRWELSFEEGRVSATTPLDFVRVIGTPQNATAEFDDGRMTTDVFSHPSLGCGDPGRYAWELSGDSLVFELISDDCPYRPAILTGVVWTRTNEG